MLGPTRSRRDSVLRQDLGEPGGLAQADRATLTRRPPRAVFIAAPDPEAKEAMPGVLVARQPELGPVAVTFQR
jgi:hypothetical protein